MSTASQGSIWRKWDLHVHTPASLHNNYPGSSDAAWEAFLRDLESLPSEFKAIGINDYVFVDGYQRVLTAKRTQNRLKNIDLILPVVELRLDKFGGTVRGGKRSSNWSRINLHVIFDEIEPEVIRQQFISAISPSYKLVPEAGGIGAWNAVISHESIKALGESIIDSVPEDKRDDFDGPLIEGFNNLCVSSDSVWRALENESLRGKFVVAVGKTEWDDLKWNDNTIAEKKTLINRAQLVFTAAESPEAYRRSRNALREAGVNTNLLDCSDAHWLKNSTDKDRIGNCFTWIKSDCTFSGLLQAIEEFEDRIFVGDMPPKRRLVDNNRTKFIRSISVAKKKDSNLPEVWFDVNLPLNSDLVAIIGNKGSGKSALADIVALAGSTKNSSRFSFLTSSRFRGHRSGLSQHFVATLEWHDGTKSTAELDKNPPAPAVERVKYLPQSYLEELCNELGERGSSTFDAELRKIIYSHVPEDERLGMSSMDDLLAFKVSEFDRTRHDLNAEMDKVNREILDLQRRAAPEFERELREQLVSRKAELSAVEASKPPPVEDPKESIEAQEESNAAVSRIAELEQTTQTIDREIAALRESKAAASKREAVARKISSALKNFRKQYDALSIEIGGMIDDGGLDLSVESLVQLKVNAAPVEQIAEHAIVEVSEIDRLLQSDEPGSLSARRLEAVKQTDEAKDALGEKQRQFVRYKDDLSAWEQRKISVYGASDKPGTVVWLESEIEALSALPAKLANLQERRANLSKEIYIQIRAMADEYQRLYGPVQSFVRAAQKMDMDLPLSFHVRIDEAGFEDHFFNRINRQVKGSFSGIEESSRRLKDCMAEADFDSMEGAVAFALQIDRMLRIDEREGQAARETRLADQLRRGVDPREVLNYIFGFGYLEPHYSLTYAGQEIGQLSPGERGLLLLIFYLLVDKDDIPIVIDQPEENLDNQTIYKVLVKCIKQAKERRQVVMVTHNPNLAVVCDAEQIIYATCDKQASSFRYEAGAMEHPAIKTRVVEILEGTEPAFKNRQVKYRLR